MRFFQKITAPEVQKYISENLTSDLTKLLLKKSPFPEVSMQEIAQQIKGKQIAAKSRLPRKAPQKKKQKTSTEGLF